MNKILIFSTIIIVLILITIPTIFKVVEEHNKRLIEVSEKRIIEAAIKCTKEEICLDNKVTLEFLYENNYLTSESDPITKQYYNIESYVDIQNQEFIIN